MILDDLEELFDDLDIDEPTPEQLEELYTFYLNDICNIIFDNVKLDVNEKKSRHPICRGKEQTFEHLLTRGSEHSPKRYFDRERANRIHWIKPIIDNYTDVRIKYFTEVNKKKELQHFFYYEEKSFIIIIRDLVNGLILITAYYVDEYRKRGFNKKYFTYKEKKTSLRK